MPDRRHRQRQTLARQLVDQMAEAAADAAEHFIGADAHVVEEQLAGVGRMHADLFQIAAALEAGQRGRRAVNSVVPLPPAFGSVLVASTTTPACWPLVMKVLEPLIK
jgi:hypothetical protein